ncbi:hypothetical protein N7I40_004104 [Vibrio parahaemolyticus]|nr:hypothetical protein [Vibrio parahaemolyticus]EJL8716155.1 hypothetical protein [Vibrio alginolyticus]EJV5946477.1 hypothetical protein [Vibrio parahaemolyticus]EKN4564979.1 hypothetical protein [Vibrio parahaemolyticus]ELJ1804495.1 hypothetical protein [Vibrio parahaemolyticus]
MKRLKNKNFFVEVPVDIYDRHVVAFIGDPKSFRSECQDMFSDPTEWIDTCRDIEDCGGFCIGMTGGRGKFELVFINTDIRPDKIEMVVWHESLHAAINILCGIGGNVNIREQEPIAYLQGHIATQILQKIRDEQKDNRKSSQISSQKLDKSENQDEMIDSSSEEAKSVTERYRASFRK